MSKRFRVRFAPSPTGPLHMGGVRTALFNYLLAKQNDGDFILRIEDTDQGRTIEGAEAYIIQALQWCGITPTEGVGFGEGPHAPYRQSDRKHLYLPYAEQLIKSGFAYYAFDSNEQLEAMRKQAEGNNSMFAYNAVTRKALCNSLTLSEAEVADKLSKNEAYVIRFKLPENEDVHLHDTIRGHVTVNTSQMDDKVLYKSDGMPTYHLANVVDDYLMQITHVIRGEEWLPSAPLHVLLYRSLGWEQSMPQFAHLPLLLKPDGKGKLSKRDGDRLGFPVFPLTWTDLASNELSIGYRERFYYPEAFTNILALLGWHPESEQEIFSMDDLIKQFTLQRVNKSGARFDPEKAKWFNQQYLHKQTNAALAAQLVQVIQGAQAGEKHTTLLSNSHFMEKICALMRDKVQFVNEIWEQGQYFFERPVSFPENILQKKWNDDAARIMAHYANLCQTQPFISREDFESGFKNSATELGLNAGNFMQLLRICITGMAGGADLFETCALLGKVEIAERIILAINVIKELRKGA
ncbi:MAG: glutamate--tRNA ligase [Bacteroidetes bacterium]|nr:glutamate--tRNA ligase [Bacteroidota bacterium]